MGSAGTSPACPSGSRTTSCACCTRSVWSMPWSGSPTCTEETMPDLKFPMEGVRRLAEATRSATTHEPTYSQRGLQVVPPGFWLVKDQGVYLLSNGDRTAHEPVYAVGLGPRADYDLVRAFAGGDDFCTF